MTPRELAMAYLQIVFHGNDYRRLGEICVPELSFDGPLFRCDSLEDCIRSLDTDPPDQFAYQLEQVFENEDVAALFYRFTKPGLSVPMAQLFKVRDGRLAAIRLLFDPTPFRSEA